MINPTRLARTIGVLYLLLFVVGPFAFLIGKAEMLVPGDAVATAANIVGSETTFRFGMTAEAIVFLVEVVASAMLYVLFRPVSRHWSLASSLARFGQAGIEAANLLTGALVLSVLGGAAVAFDAAQQNGLMLLFMEANAFMVHVWGLFFGLHLAILGWLVVRSGFMPRLIGWLLAAASVGYLADSFGAIVAPGSADLLATVVLVLSIPGELAFTVWLVWKGVDAAAWRERAAASA